MAVIAERFDQHRREGAGGEPLLGSAQYVRGVLGRHGNKTRRVEAKGEKTWTVRLARLVAGHFGPHPQPEAIATSRCQKQPGTCQRETACRSHIGSADRAYIVQRTALQAASRRVDLGMAEGNSRRLRPCPSVCCPPASKDRHWRGTANGGRHIVHRHASHFFHRGRIGTPLTSATRSLQLRDLPSKHSNPVRRLAREHGYNPRFRGLCSLYVPV